MNYWVDGSLKVAINNAFDSHVPLSQTEYEVIWMISSYHLAPVYISRYL